MFIHLYNKAIVDSRLRPQWCFHLANVTEMEEMLDCKLDALIRSFAWEKKRFSWQHKSARITWPLTLTLSTPWMQAYLGTIMCQFGGDPAICLRELMVGANSHEFSTLCTNWLQYLAPPLPRAGEITNEKWSRQINNYIIRITCSIMMPDNDENTMITVTHLQILQWQQATRSVHNWWHIWVTEWMTAVKLELNETIIIINTLTMTITYQLI